MAHAVYIKDVAFNDVVDVEWFCSDFCARGHAQYDGWNGCLENYTAPFCQNEACNAKLNWFNENESVWFYGTEPQEKTA
jgi:hypothetical protein